MKIKVIIEETISQEFEVEVSSIENAVTEVQEMYRDGSIVVDNANLLDAQLGILDKDGVVDSWDCIM